MAELTGRATRLPTVAGYGALLRSRALVIVLVTALGGLFGYGWEAQKPRPYQASAAISLPDISVYVDLDPDGTAPKPATIDTTAQLVYSGAVLRRVSQATAESVSAVSDGLTVSAYPLSRVLVVSFQAATAETAISGANEAARATLRERARVLAGAQLSQTRALYQRLSNLRNQAHRDVSQFPAVARRIDTRMQHLSRLLTAQPVVAGQVVDEAGAADRVGVHPELHITTGLVTGFVLAVGWAWWWRPALRGVAPGRPLSAGAG